MNTRMPPGQIMMLIEIHCFVFEDQLRSLNGSPASKKFIRRLVREELIAVNPCVPMPDEERERHPFVTTPRGRALINKWCETDLPVLVETWT